MTGGAAEAVSSRRSLVVLGFATVLAQSVLLREAMSSLGGSELAWGVVLFTWLAGMAAGAALAVRVGAPGLGNAMPWLSLLLAGFGLLLFRAAPALVAGAGGEAVGTVQALWLWPLAVFPAAAAGGAGFTLLASRASGPSGGARAYALEAAGGLTGGLLFTFFLVPHGTVFALLLGAGLAVTALLRPRRLWMGAALTILLLLASSPADRLLAHWTWRWAGRPGTLAAWSETHQERLELASGTPAALYANGRLLASFPNPWATAPRAHLLLLLHPRPRRVLLVGGLAGGSVLTVLTHPLERLDLVEDDPELPGLLRRWYGPAFRKALDDPRVHLHLEDPIRVVRHGGPWDLILLLDGDPASLRENRTRTVEFFGACRRRLAAGGLLAVSTGVGDTYLSGVGGRLISIEASTLRRVFGNVTALPGERVTLLAGRGRPPRLSTRVLADRWRALEIRDPVFSAELLPVLLDPSRSQDLQRFLRHTRAPPNTSSHPRAVLPSMALREGRTSSWIVRTILRLSRSSPAILLAIPLGLLGLMVVKLLRGRLPGPETAAVVGASSMTWWLVLAATWQGTLGSVYTEVGALSAAFMGGLALAAFGALRWPAGERHLPALLAAGGLLSTIMATPLPSSHPRLLIPLLLVAGGALTGAAFPGLARLIGRTDPRRGGGGGFAADEAGAAVAALGAGLLGLPWAGFRATSLAIGALDLAAAFLLAAALAFHRRRQAAA